MKIAITGANSFIGIKLIEQIRFIGWDIIAIVRPNNSMIPELLSIQGVTVCECSMDNYKDIGRKLGHIDCLVHLAWNGTRGESRQDISKQMNNYLYSMELIKSIIDYGCKKIVTAGSQAEYGKSNNIIYETSECYPNTEYGIYKLKFYEEASLYCKDNGVVLIEPRYFSLYGPDDCEDTMIINCINKMLHNEPCNLTLGIQKWDFLYIDDAIRALVLLIKKDVNSGIYNFGSGDCRQLKDFVIQIKSMLKSDSELNFGAIPYPETGMVSIYPCVNKLKQKINWEPKVSFEKGISIIVEGMKKK